MFKEHDCRFDRLSTTPFFNPLLSFLQSDKTTKWLMVYTENRFLILLCKPIGQDKLCSAQPKRNNAQSIRHALMCCRWVAMRWYPFGKCDISTLELSAQTNASDWWLNDRPSIRDCPLSSTHELGDSSFINGLVKNLQTLHLYFDGRPSNMLYNITPEYKGHGVEDIDESRLNGYYKAIHVSAFLGWSNLNQLKSNSNIYWLFSILFIN